MWPVLTWCESVGINCLCINIHYISHHIFYLSPCNSTAFDGISQIKIMYKKKVRPRSDWSDYRNGPCFLTPPHLSRHVYLHLVLHWRYSDKMAVEARKKQPIWSFFIFIYEISDQLSESADIYHHNIKYRNIEIPAFTHINTYQFQDIKKSCHFF